MGAAMVREDVNRNVVRLLSRFSTVDTAALLVEAQRVSETALLETSGLVDRNGRVKLHLIGLMEALLTMALGGRSSFRIPNDLTAVRDALVLFLKLNHTQRFAYRVDDTPMSWTVRLLDHLFATFAERDLLTLQDRLVLRRISESGVWETAFSAALELYVRAVEGGAALLAEADRPAMASAATTFKKAVRQRYDRVPKTKYGNPNANFRDVTEYAIGQYLGGLDVNEALSQTLVQAQLGIGSDHGQARFEAFLKANKITPQTFPTTVKELHNTVGRSIPFRETEAEIANALYAYASHVGKARDMRAVFASFTESVLPVAAKCAKLFRFAHMDQTDRAHLIARWMRDTSALGAVRGMSLRDEVELLLPQITKDDLQNLGAFRGGRTKGARLTEAELDGYVKTRTDLLTLNAINQKMKRVEDAILAQIAKTERFTAQPGQAQPRDTTFGIQEFFRCMRAVFEDIFEIADTNRRQQLQSLSTFNRAYGPLSLVNMLVPRERKVRIEDWVPQARARLAEVPYYVFEGE
ncbi:hypothetical protein [Rhodothalassium salexigens]|nr:hypothetical protein [Rhodothalassium salexigens]MBB4210763.1 hypothetical protein [Rhodothalassium salexigens DSM 2132]